MLSRRSGNVVLCIYFIGVGHIREHHQIYSIDSYSIYSRIKLGLIAVPVTSNIGFKTSEFKNTHGREFMYWATSGIEKNPSLERFNKISAVLRCNNITCDTVSGLKLQASNQ